MALLIDSLSEESAMPRLNLVVIRARNAARLAEFYTVLGLSFALHRHGTGPEHFSAENESGVFEIYPVKGDEEPTRNLRLGFEVKGVKATVSDLVKAGAKMVQSPMDSPWGLRAVIQDLEGHKVEITEARDPLT
ncbi:VOC family protein [Prosthecobacter sp. SYSU 5D2]|uniref:VOC family protein n=1 Tax=Prosthecobacter sp. SYSU 5D2 TaxID=3134134 RepID=UPI0031FE8D57